MKITIWLYFNFQGTGGATLQKTYSFLDAFFNLDYIDVDCFDFKVESKGFSVDHDEFELTAVKDFKSKDKMIASIEYLEGLGWK